jgi:UDPglucose 6-dehydrogenase
MKNKVTVIGNWHLSYCYVGYLSQFNEVDYLVTDHDSYEKLLKERVVIEEPGIQELFIENDKCISINLYQNTSDFNSVTIIAEDTEINNNNEPNITKILKICEKINSVVKRNTEVIISSQIPVSTTELIKSEVFRDNPFISVTVFPENLQLGNSLEKLTNPNFIFYGVDSNSDHKSSLSEVFNYNDQEKIIKTDYNSAELIKHGINSFLASNIIFGNELGKIIRDFKGDLDLIIRAIKLDPRISPHAPMKPGVPISGGTLLRDIQVLSRKSQDLDNYWSGLNKINEDYKGIVYQVLLKYYLEDLSEINCLILGSNYKINSNSARNSYSRDLVKLLDQKVNSLYITKSTDTVMVDRGNATTISRMNEIITKIDCIVLLYNQFSSDEYLQFISKNPGIFIIDFVNKRDFYDNLEVELLLLGE